MKRKIIILFLFLSHSIYSQEKGVNAFMIDYSYQIPSGILAEKFSNNSSIGINYFKKNNSSFFYGLKANYIFGANIKDSTIFNSISTDEDFVIDGNGTYSNIILLQEGFSSHLYIGYALELKDNNPNGFYFSVGLGFLQHRIFIDTKNQYIPQLSNDYKKGYDQLTNGLSTQFIIDYMILEDKKKFKLFTGIDYTLGFTKNRRVYDFNNMNITDQSMRYDKLLGFHIGLIIPINRKNTEEFHYF
jgi:hypothetical protein